MVLWNAAWPWGMVAAEARPHVAGQQAAGILPWVDAHSNEDVQRLRDEHKNIGHLHQNFQLGGPEKHTGTDDPWHAVQESGGVGRFLVPG